MVFSRFRIYRSKVSILIKTAVFDLLCASQIILEILPRLEITFRRCLHVICASEFKSIIILTQSSLHHFKSSWNHLSFHAHNRMNVLRQQVYLRK